jgi:hypothetical protein
MTTEWILILWIYMYKAGAMTSVPFPTKNACQNAGEAVKKLHSETKYVCVPRDV